MQAPTSHLRAETESVTLVLAAHGSDHDPRCAAPVHRHADVLRRRGAYRNVASVFWKESPAFSDLDAVAQGEIVVVPMMTASGYYVSTVLPRELRLNDPSRASRIRVARAIGEFDEMTPIIKEQAVRAATQAGVDPRSAALMLVGHGTRRDPVRSGATTHRHARNLAELGEFLCVQAAFLEQEPTIAEAFEAIPGSGPVIVVPFLIASGGHGADDIPRALGCEAGAVRGIAGGREVIFAPAVGEHEAIADIVLLAAAEAIGCGEAL